MFSDIKRPEISDENIEKTINEVVETYRRKLTSKGKGAFVSTHEILGKMEEECYEVLKEVHKNKLNEMKNELMDVIVVCMHGIASLNEEFDSFLKK